MHAFVHRFLRKHTAFRKVWVFTLLLLALQPETSAESLLLNTKYDGRKLEIISSQSQMDNTNTYRVAWGLGYNVYEPGWEKGSFPLVKGPDGKFSCRIDLPGRVSRPHFILQRQGPSGVVLERLVYPSEIPADLAAGRTQRARQFAVFAAGCEDGQFTGNLLYRLAEIDEIEFAAMDQGITNYAAWVEAFTVTNYTERASFPLNEPIPVARQTVYDVVKAYVLARMQKNPEVLRAICDKDAMKYLVTMGLENPGKPDLLLRNHRIPGLSEIRIISSAAIQVAGACFVRTVVRCSSGSGAKDGSVHYLGVDTFSKNRSAPKVCDMFGVSTGLDLLFSLAGVKETTGPKEKIVPFLRATPLPPIYTEW